MEEVSAGEVVSAVTEPETEKLPTEDPPLEPEPMNVDEPGEPESSKMDIETEKEPIAEMEQSNGETIKPLTNGVSSSEIDQTKNTVPHDPHTEKDADMIVDVPKVTDVKDLSVQENNSADTAPSLEIECSLNNSPVLPSDNFLHPNDVCMRADKSAAFISVTVSEDKEVPNNYAAEEVSNEGDASKSKSDDSATADTSSEHVNGDKQTLSDSANNCYCGKRRILGSVELQCAGCYKWFHKKCISIPLGKVLPFMTYYTYFCKLCNPSGVETFSKKQPNFSQMCAATIANLTYQSQKQSEPKSMFSKDKEIIPYIDVNWEMLTSMPRRVKQTWHSTVYKSMMKDNDVFLWDEKKGDESRSGYYPTFGLVNQDLSKIAPSYDSMARGGLQKQIQDMAQSGGFTGGKGRSAKRRVFGDGPLSAGGKKIKSDLVMPKLPPNGYPLEHPFNKDGYRYILAEPDPHAPFRQEFDESQDWAGKPIPGWLYRKLTPSNVLLALHDRAPQLKVSEDRLSVTGEKGYCMIRATHGVSRGTWYFEINIEEMSDGSATRLGWSQGLGNLQAPLGYDKFSYSWRSRKGTKFHESRGYHYADEGYSQGDTLGFLIELPPTTDAVPLPPIFKDKPLVKFKSYLYYEEKDEAQLELKRLRPLCGSKITFFKNGKSYGVAFKDVHEGIYYPAASLYKNCTASFNFGPDFKYPPDVPVRGMYEAALESLLEQMMTDLLFFTENKGKLRLDNIV